MEASFPSGEAGVVRNAIGDGTLGSVGACRDLLIVGYPTDIGSSAHENRLNGNNISISDIVGIDNDQDGSLIARANSED